MPISNQTQLREFITKLPKADLHVHLDGSVRIETLIDLSKQHNLLLPSYTVAGLNELVFKDEYKDLVEYLTGFGYVLPVMQTPEDLERISYEFALDNINEGVYYTEVKFAPQLHINEKQDFAEILIAVNKGLERAKNEFNKKDAVKSGKLPEFHYGIIVCTMRFFAQGFSKYYDDFLAAHKGLNQNAVFALASAEMVKACVKVRDEHNIPIVACDLVGAEAGNPPIHFKKAYHFAKQNLMHSIVHAGEAYGAESIYQAVTELDAERLGHGTMLFSEDGIKDPSIKNKAQFLQKLIQYIAERRITIEVCLTSNLQTLPHIKDIANHSFVEMLAAGLSTTICTDNRTFSKTSMTKELMLAIQHFDLSRHNLRRILIDSFAKSFMPINYLQKELYLTKIEALCDALINEYKY
ncbi:MAG: adenosine deaminase family protein [Gammaproteobacteria bacterium]|nr:adenosine deaminase family protein [Gammaproteobacteria bacterium]